MTTAVLATCAVRTATAEDIPALVELGVEFLTTSPYAEHITPNRDAITKTLEMVVELGGVFVGLQRGVIVSMIGLVIIPHPWSGERVASELFWFSSRFLKGCLGMRLLSHAEQWAADHGVRVVQMVAPDDRIGRLYFRRGYASVESVWQRRTEE
jgi:GNAT superfamily N-acetyltransferase